MHNVNIIAYSGRQKEFHGYHFEGDPSAEVYKGSPDLYWPLTRKETICFVIWDVDKMKAVYIK